MRISLHPFLWLALLAPGVLVGRGLSQLPPGSVVVAGPGFVEAAEARRLLGDAFDMDPVTLSGRLGPERFESAARVVLEGFMQERPGARERRWIEALQVYESRVWRQHPETAAAWFLPAYGLADTAQRVSRHWAFRDAVDALLAAPLEWKHAVLADPLVLAAALERLPDFELLRLVGAGVPQGLGQGVWQVLLIRSVDARLWWQAMGDAPDGALRRVLPKVWSINPADARRWLDALRVQRPTLRSAAVFAYAGDPDPVERRARWMEGLTRPDEWAAAAAALARDASLRDQDLIDGLKASKSDGVRGWELALRLRDTPATRAALVLHEAAQRRVRHESEPSQ